MLRDDAFSREQIAAVLDAALNQVECDPQPTWAAVQQAIASADRLGNALLHARAQYVAGVCLTTIGKFVAAQTMFQAACSVFEANNRYNMVGCCWRDEGVAAYFAGDHATAQARFSTAIPVLESYTTALETSRCLRWMAVLENFSHNTPLAQKRLKTAWMLLDADDPLADHAACFFVEGMIETCCLNFSAALNAFAEAASRFAKLGQEVALGRVYCEQGYALLAQEKLPAAEDVTLKALYLFRKHQIPYRVGLASELLALIATANNQFERAYALVAEAQALYQAANMQVHSLQALLHKGNLDYYLEAWGDAEAAYQEVASWGRDYGMQHLALVADSNLGLLAWKQVRYDAGLAYTRMALEEAVQLGRDDDAARCHRQLAGLYTDIGEQLRAQHHYKQAFIILSETKLSLSFARVQVEYTELCQRNGEYDEAASSLAAARKSFEEQELTVFIADCDLQRGRLALTLGNLEQATALADASATVYREQQMPLRLGRVYQFQGEIAAARQDYSEAIQQHKRAFKILFEPVPAEAASVAAALGYFLQRLENPKASLEWFCTTVRLLQQARGRMPTEHLAAQLAEQYAPQLQAALKLALEINESILALALVEDTRSQVVLAWLEGVRRHLPADALSRQLAGQSQSLRRKVEDLRTTLGATAEEVNTRAMHDRLQQLLAQYDETLALWRRFGSGIVPGKVQPFDWQTCYAQLYSLPAGWQALVYWLAGSSLIIWHCTADGVRNWQQEPTPRDTFALHLCCNPNFSTRMFMYNHHADTLYSTSQAAPELERVARLLLPPDLERSLHVDDLLIIVPAGNLHTLPFAALPLADRPLVAWATLLLAPSLQLLTRLIAQPVSQAERALGIGVKQHPQRQLDSPTSCSTGSATDPMSSDFSESFLYQSSLQIEHMLGILATRSVLPSG